VHFALAFALAGALAEAAGILLARDRLERWGSVLVLLGTGAVVLAVASGYLAANTAPGFTPAGEAALAVHERFALLGAGMLVVLVVWKGLGGGRIAGRHRLLYALALMMAAALLLAAALQGGRLVYTHGVGVEIRGQD
jgi:uncharacterized membrane protein